MQHRRFAIIVPRDPAGNVMRVREIAIDAVRRRAIPSGDRRQRQPREQIAGTAETLAAEVRVELVPRVSHRRVAVAEMPSSSGSHNRLRRAVAGRNDEVRVIQVEQLDRRRKQRKHLAVAPGRSRQPLQRRRPDPP
jgi:hypothetical protein